jgi:hypothetical protein
METISTNINRPMVEQKIVFFSIVNGICDCSQIYDCFSNLVEKKENFRSFTKKIVGTNINIHMNYDFSQYTKFNNGQLMIDNKEYKINDYELYYSLLLDEKIHSKIGVCTVDKEVLQIIKNNS